MRLEAEWLVRRKMINFDAKHLIPDELGKERGGCINLNRVLWA